MVTVEHGTGAHRRGVRTGLALGERVAEHRVAGGERRQHLLLQLGRAGEDDRLRAELVHGGDQRGRGAGARDLLDHDAGRDRVGPGAAVLLGDVHGVKTRPHEGIEHVMRELGRLVDLGGPRRDLVVRELSNRRANHVLLVGELVRVEVRITDTHGANSRTT